MPNSTQPIHLAIDGNEANTSNRVGSNVYAYELLKALAQLVKSNRQVRVTVLLSSSPLRDLPRTTGNWRYKVITPKLLWTQWALPIHLFLHASEYDVLFTPGHYAPRISSIPYISSVMDLAFLLYPDQFNTRDLLQLKDWTRYSVKNARKVVAISEYTKADVIKRYGKKADDIIVAPPAVVPPSFTPTAKDGATVTKKFKVTNPYIIHIGTIQPRKNIVRLIEAFEKVNRKLAAHRKRNQPEKYQLVLVGKVGWLAEPIMDRIAQSPFAKDIIVTGFTTESEKQTLLAYSQCSAHLGLYEGFGIPALESLYAGTIPIVANNTSLPEVVGEAGVPVDPENVESIASAIYFVLSLPAKQRARLRRVARTQRQAFDWTASAEKILDALLQLAKTKGR